MKKSSIFLIVLAAIITIGICFYGEVKDKKEVAQYEATYKKQSKEENILQERDENKEKENTTSKEEKEIEKKEEPKKVKPVKKEAKKEKKENEEQTTGYTIKEGDDLQVIANKCGISIDELMKMNQWTSLPIVQPGQVIQVPANKVSALGGENISQQAPISTPSAPVAPETQNNGVQSNGVQGTVPTPTPVPQPVAPTPVVQ